MSFSSLIPITRFTQLNHWKAWQHFLSKQNNDLEKSVFLLQPAVRILLDTLKQQHQCELARMSGSGSTCFALFSDFTAAIDAEKILKEVFSNDWIQLTTLI